jgi:hypothetical protein
LAQNKFTDHLNPVWWIMIIMKIYQNQHGACYVKLVYTCTNTLFFFCNLQESCVSLYLYKKEKNVPSTSLPVKGGSDPP